MSWNNRVFLLLLHHFLILLIFVNIISVTVQCRHLPAGSAANSDLFANQKKLDKEAHAYLAEQESDKIENGLPGQPPDTISSIAQYAGYITVNESAGRALFYWLVETPVYDSASNSSKAPLVLWLNGGPGCSSMGYGGMEEFGPFRIYPNGTGLYTNPFSWNQVANILFLESPAGVGYSYSNTSSDYVTSGDSRTAEDSLAFLVAWMQRFPQYRHREFYITGESYAGHYVPQLAEKIYDYNQKLGKPFINLKGFMVGNAVTDWESDNAGIVQYYFSHALISDDTYTGLLKTCPWWPAGSGKDNDSTTDGKSSTGNATTPNNSNDTKNNNNDDNNNVQQQQQRLPSECQKWLDQAYADIGNIDLHTIYTPVCLTPDPYQTSNVQINNRQRQGYTYPAALRHWNPLNSGETGYDPCTPNYADSYFNRVDVQHAFHANTTGFIQRPWTICNYDILDNWKDRAYTVLPIYKKLIKAGLRIWIYSGDEDAMVPVSGTRVWLKKLGLKTTKRWYPWISQGQVGGWSQTYENGVTFVTVRGAGHEVPVLQPERALVLFSSFIHGKRMPSH